MSRDESLPAQVASLVTEPLWVRFEGGEETASTNDDCRALAEAGAPEGTVVVAARQTAGRGRLGRAWESPEGGAYFSALLRPGMPPDRIPLLGLVVGLGVADGLEALGAHVLLKWPNDILDAVSRRKVAGILLEAASAGAPEWVVAGCGVDVRRPEEALESAAYLSDVLGADLAPARVIAAALYGVAGAYGRWRAGEAASLLVEYERRSVLRGREVVAYDGAGKAVAEGCVVGLDPTGALLLERDGEVLPVASGEVTLREPGGSP